MEQKTYPPRKEELLPDGNHAMRLKDAIFYTTKNGKKTFKFILVVSKPNTQYDGWEVHRMVWNTEASARILEREINRLGVDIKPQAGKLPDGEFLRDDLEKVVQPLLGRMLTVLKTTAIGRDQGKQFTNFSFVNFEPLSEAEESNESNANGYDGEELPF